MKHLSAVDGLSSNKFPVGQWWSICIRNQKVELGVIQLLTGELVILFPNMPLSLTEIK